MTDLASSGSQDPAPCQDSGLFVRQHDSFSKYKQPKQQHQSNKSTFNQPQQSNSSNYKSHQEQQQQSNNSSYKSPQAVRQQPNGWGQVRLKTMKGFGIKLPFEIYLMNQTVGKYYYYYI